MVYQEMEDLVNNLYSVVLLCLFCKNFILNRQKSYSFDREFVSSFLGAKEMCQRRLFTQEKFITRESDCNLRYCNLREKNGNMTKFSLSLGFLSGSK